MAGLAGALLACACAPPSVGRAPAAALAPPPATFPEDPRPLAQYHSVRLGVAVPLPDGKAWRIDDHSTPDLVATHAPTRSRVLVAVLRTEALVGRQQCKALAIERKLVPAVEMQTIEDATEVRQEVFDTRIKVGVVPGAGPGDPVVGHVMAFGGFLRKCFVFDFMTVATGAGKEDAVSERLAVVRARVLGGLRVDPFGVVAHEKR